MDDFTKDHYQTAEAEGLEVTWVDSGLIVVQMILDEEGSVPVGYNWLEGTCGDIFGKSMTTWVNSIYKLQYL